MGMPDPSLVRFRRAVASACAALEGRRQEVNDLNVFPVADGDTGDNMAMTMRAVLDELDSLNGQMIDEIGREELVSAVAPYAWVQNPAEGTMLSAVRAMAHRVAHDLAHMDNVRLGPGATDEEQD